MKKIKILIILTLFLFISCDLEKTSDGISKVADAVPENLQSPTKQDIADDVGVKVINAFVDKDEQALYEFLSENAKKNKNISETINKSFNFIEGDIISYDTPFVDGGGGKSVEKGNITWEDFGVSTRNIKTSSGKTYVIALQFVEHCDKNPDKIGLDGIDVFSDDLDNNGFPLYVEIG